MEYQVPQFIEVEDKIVGPLTFRQFLYLGGAAGFVVVCFAYLSFIFAALVALPVVGLAIALAFYKINGKPFIEMMEAGFAYIVGAKLFLWKKREIKEAEERTTAAAAAAAAALLNAPRPAPRLTSGKLSELAYSLDTHGSLPPRSSR